MYPKNTAWLIVVGVPEIVLIQIRSFNSIVSDGSNSVIENDPAA